MITNKAFYLEELKKGQNRLVDFSEYKCDKYRFRCGKYYFKSREDQDRFRFQKKFDYKQNYNKLIREVDPSIEILNEKIKRNRYRDGNGNLNFDNINQHLPKDYNYNVNKVRQKNIAYREDKLFKNFKF